jgi:hypothetical protein
MPYFTILDAFSAGGAIEKANHVFQPDERFWAASSAPGSWRDWNARLLI